MPYAQALLLTVYYALLAGVLIVMTYRATLVVRYFLRERRDPGPPARFPTPPFVTIQLPVYNERFVVDRLIERACALDWPRDRLQIQVLDDSTDDTILLSTRKVAEMRARGFDIELLHRTVRTGFKAGALRAATARARGEFLAVFDADFLPDTDFLRRTVDHFTDPRVAFVQGRWSYVNRGHNALTQGMGMLLDGHFVLEQTTRSRGGLVFNFNGTAGIWRRRAIETAGGWHDDTICEDTDLSYRTYLAGWRGVFLRDLSVPSELPVQITALKSQQHRWAKGLTECFLKSIADVWQSRLPLRAKLEASFHLGGNLAYPITLFLTVVALPVMLLRAQGAAQGHVAALVDSLALLLAAMTQVVFYVVATREIHRDWPRRLLWLPFFPLVGVGLVINNARGVMEALTGLRTEFVRTPKLGVLEGDRGLVRRRERTYTGGRDLGQALVEILLGFYYVYIGAVQWSLAGAPALLTLFLSLGPFMTGGATVRALWLKRQRQGGSAARGAPTARRRRGALPAPSSAQP